MVTTKNKSSLQQSAIAFINLLKKFECKKDMDPYWQIIFPFNKKWKYLHISEYQKIFYVNEVISDGLIEIEPGKNRIEQSDNGSSRSQYGQFNSTAWRQLFTAANEWLKKVERDWVQSNRLLIEQFPIAYRQGIVPSCIVAEYFPEYKHLRKNLGIRNVQKMVSIIDDGALKRYEAGMVAKFTANNYFEYCKLAYKAVNLAREEESGRDLYKKNADGRHEGLLEIDPDSEREFADWIDHKHSKRLIGGHPLEILRGGNTSNIQLNVSRPMYGDKTGFKIQVYATGITRLAESIKIFLEIYKADKPIAILEPDTVREQLLLLDNIGILPEHSTLHRGVQVFEKSENVNDVAHLSFFKSRLSRIKPFITWEPLPILKPRNS